MTIRNKINPWIREHMSFQDLNDTFGFSEYVAMKGTAQNAYQVLKNAGSFDNEDNLFADRFTANNGVKNTIFFIDNDYSGVDTTHTQGSVSNSPNAFDNNNSTFASIGSPAGVGKTFSARTIGAYEIYVSNASNNNEYLQTYDGSSWTTIRTFTASNGSPTTYTGLINSSIQGIRVYSQDGGVRVYSLRYGDSSLTANYDETNDHYECQGGAGSYSNSTVKMRITNTNWTGNEMSLFLFIKSTNTANTSITADISDGTTTLSAQDINDTINVNSLDLSSGTLDITFNLNTTNVNDTPTVSGYGGYII